MTTAYLYFNAACYVVFGLWMTYSPWKTAAAVGYLAFTGGGRSEYLVIYGGLQLGLAAFFTVCAVSMPGAGLLFALCLYTPIVLYRIVTLTKFGPVSSVTVAVAILELVLLVCAALLFLRSADQR